jgi:predicted thioredoxin/glutaredoxin
MVLREVLEPRQYSQCLPVTLKTAKRSHTVVERHLTAVTERRMPEVMAKAGGLNEAEWWEKLARRVAAVFLAKLTHHATGDLRNLQGVRKSGPIKVAVAQIENLGLSLKAPKRS